LGSVTLVEDQHRLALEQLRRAGEQPVSFAALRAAGLDSPAAVISELELNGHAIRRVYEHGLLVGLCLIEPEQADTGAGGRRRWWSRRYR
jgi:Helix-turn-helix domain